MSKLILLFTIIITASSQTTITIDWGFDSTQVTGIEVGDTVIWDWYSSGTHNVKTTPSAPMQFDSGYFGKGKTFSYTFTEQGLYEYKCTRHVNMYGTITVVAEGALGTCTGVDTPYANCVVPACTHSSVLPYDGCTIAACTDVDTPYANCVVPACTHSSVLPYDGCTLTNDQCTEYNQRCSRFAACPTSLEKCDANGLEEIKRLYNGHHDKSC